MCWDSVQNVNSNQVVAYIVQNPALVSYTQVLYLKQTNAWDSGNFVKKCTSKDISKAFERHIFICYDSIWILHEKLGNFSLTLWKLA